MSKQNFFILTETDECQPDELAHVNADFSFIIVEFNVR